MKTNVSPATNNFLDAINLVLNTYTLSPVDQKIKLHKLDIIKSKAYVVTGSSFTCQIVNNVYLSTDIILI